MSDHETNRAYPPRPPYEPSALNTAPEPTPEPAPGPVPGAHARRRARRPVGLLAAVAIVAAAVGGGTATLAAGTFGNGAAPAATSSVLGTNAADTGTGVAEVVKAVTPSVVEIGASSRSGSATGSGVVISEKGEILTNNHVVSGATEIEVTFSDGDTARAEIVGTEPDLDMALIRVEDAGDLTPAELGDSDAVRVGDRVVAFGSPQGLSGTVTSGIVSAKGREVTVERTGEEGRPRDDRSWPFEFDGDRYNGELGSETTTYEAIQTDASLNPGNSGGPLVDMNGRVIGINSAIHSNASTAAEAGSVGLGFAVPVDDVEEILDDLRAGG
ncbi:S1C family serine protease [Streptomyces fenghuangensis]|uniref:S1C family serine protease n=1 Tax=Streptomyces chitinivorans TaxID=1257027 RepID=A0ABW7HZ63_9ACTN|nr:trypsin-like peptidase domain-containing protein [Streptomyces chitinivorans]MDH2409718.1 trypsin-like peptidase domain-containing protein [Streptomyces chitinivorans]